MSSPLCRAQQTAAVIAHTLGVVPADPVDAFAEWRAPYCVLGRASEQYPPEYQAWREHRVQQPDFALAGGDSIQAFAERAGEALSIARELTAQHPRVLIVSHRLLIGAVAAISHGYRQAADIFTAASDFRLGPARLWARQEE